MRLEDLKSAIENQTGYKVKIIDTYRAAINGEIVFIEGGLIRVPGGEVHLFKDPSGLIGILRFTKILKVSDEKMSHIIGRVQNITNFKLK